MDVAIMRTTKPRAMPTILRLIDWLNMGFGPGGWKGKSESWGVRPGLPRIGLRPLSWTMFGAPALAVLAGFAGPVIISRRASLSCTKGDFSLFNNNEARRLA